MLCKVKSCSVNIYNITTRRAISILFTLYMTFRLYYFSNILNSSNTEIKTNSSIRQWKVEGTIWNKLGLCYVENSMVVTIDSNGKSVEAYDKDNGETIMTTMLKTMKYHIIS